MRLSGTGAFHTQLACSDSAELPACGGARSLHLFPGSMRRRDFLRYGGLGLGAAAGLSIFPRRGMADPFGTFPDESAQLPLASQAKNVLEVYLYGGLSCWETLYFVPGYGQSNGTQFYTFGGPANTGPDSVAAAITSCGSLIANTADGVPFAADANQKTVNLGPFADPLRARADVTGRMRLFVMRHDLEPHEAAVPLALTGKKVGSPSLAGLGAHIQRYFTDRPDPARTTPYSYVFSTGGIPGDNVSAAYATGMHSGVARPLHIDISSASGLFPLLARGAVGDATQQQQYDALLGVYVKQYQKQLAWGGSGTPLRSPRFSDVAQAVAQVSNSQAIASVLDPSYFTPVGGTVCGDSNGINVPAMSLKLAVHLLTHPTQPAKYVCVSDTGLLEASGGGGYDTHTTNSHDTARNFANVLSTLMGLINAPGETDPTKLNLDETLIVFNTEFGRTPDAQGGDGRNHHPYGYCQAFIGGPITSAQMGVQGAIGPDGIASSWMTPAEARIGALLAMGIWPFAQESFFVSDVQGVASELDGVKSVTQRALGYSL